MREIKFRQFDKDTKKFHYWGFTGFYPETFASPLVGSQNGEQKDSQQFTGLKDKNYLQEVYEGDIIDKEGNIKGNIYEMDKGKTDFVIQGFGTRAWCETYRRAILLGLKDA